MSVLFAGGFGDEHLDNTEALAMGGYLGETVLYFINYESPLGLLEALDDVLDDVSALGVLGRQRRVILHTRAPPHVRQAPSKRRRPLVLDSRDR